MERRIANISLADPFLSASKTRAKLESEGRNPPLIQMNKRRLYAAEKHGRVVKRTFSTKQNIKKRMNFYYAYVEVFSVLGKNIMDQ